MPKKTKNQRPNSPTPPPKPPDRKLPFIEHVYELRRRLFYVAVSVISFGLAGYFIQQHLVHWLLKPSKGQQFIYTTPTGGLNFLFQVCIYFGITLSIPVMIYQLLRYIEPLIHHHTKRMVLRFSFCSWLLAIGGAAFGYYAGLPIALRFLSHQFTTTQIKPLLTIQEYMSFVTIYLLGSALLFQVPLILLFINRIKPLSPKKLLSFERYFIAIAFIAAAIMTPTPDVFNQLLFVGPIIAVYQIGILLVFLNNRRAGQPTVPADSQPKAEHLRSLPNPFLVDETPLASSTRVPLVKPAAATSSVLRQSRGRPTYSSRPILDAAPRPMARRSAAVWDIA